MMIYKVAPKYIWGAGVVLVIFLTAIDRLIPILSYYLGLGAAPGGFIRGGFIAMCLLGGGLSIRRSLTKLDITAATLLSVFLIYSLIVYSFSEVPEKWFSYYSSFTSYYFYLYMFFLVFITRIRLSESIATLITVGVCIALGCVAILQWFLNDPIVDLEALRGELELAFNEIYFYGHVRGFSFFSSGLASGLFCNLGFAVCFSKFIFSRSWTLSAFIWGAGAFFFLVVGYVTLTRVVYAQSLIIMAYVLSYKYFPRLRNRFLAYSLFSLCAGLILAVAVPLAFGSNSGVASSESLQIRFGTWSKYLIEMYYSSIPEIMFGKQGVQAAVLPPAESIIFDNTFIAIFYQVGIVGLILWAAIFISFSNYAYRMADDMEWPAFACGIFAYFNTWLFIGMFNTRPGAGCLALSLLCVVWNGIKYRGRVLAHS